MADLAFFLHLFQIRNNAILRIIQVCIDVQLTDIVHQIEIKILHLTFFELFCKNFFYLRHIGKIIAGELRGKIEVFTRIFLQSFSHYQLRIPVMISPCGIIVIDAACHGIIHHFLRFFFVNLTVIPVNDRKPHRAHSQCRQFHVLKSFVNHVPLLFFVTCTQNLFWYFFTNRITDHMLRNAKTFRDPGPDGRIRRLPIHLLLLLLRLIFIFQQFRRDFPDQTRASSCTASPSAFCALFHL